MENLDLLIIGGGQSGLASAHAARQAGRSFILLEATDRAMGSWPHYYDSLTLFSPARYSSLPGMPFPGDPDRYPTRDEVVGYLVDYAKQFEDELRFNQRVENVTYNDGFVVETQQGDRFRAATLIAASGQFEAPNRPVLPGLESFTGTVLHSAQYRSPEQFIDRRVVVVGAGNSAIQIAIELAEVADTTVATRGDIRWIKQRPFGRDFHWWLKWTQLDIAPLSRWLPKLPATVLDTGRYRQAIATGKPDHRPMFSRIAGAEVIWGDGTREQVDALIFATGFRPNIPYLRELGALDASGVPLHRGGISTVVPGLGYVGLEFERNFSSNTLRGCGRDARHIVARLSSEISKPQPISV